MSRSIRDIIPTGIGTHSDSVLGPATSTNNALPRFDGVDGQLIKDSNVIVTNSGSITIPENINLTGGNYIYLRGDVDTNGSVRVFSNESGSFNVQERVAGIWEEIKIGAGVEYVTAPATPTSTGTQGQFAYSGNYLYVCVAADTWIRTAAESTWS